MKPNVLDIYNKINEYAPFEEALDWDNSGLLVGDFENGVDRVLVALDLDDDVVDKAVSDHADLVVTHHPLIFGSLKAVTTEDFIARRVIKLIENHISVIAAHTNYDKAVMGELAASKLGIKNAEPLDDDGIGVIGDINPTDLKSITFSTKIAFELDAVRVYGENRQVKKIAVTPGSGGSCVKSAIEKGADVYITGDISHHTGIDAVAQNLAVIDAGHAGLEHVFVPDMAAMLRLSFPAVYVDSTEKISPFETV